MNTIQKIAGRIQPLPSKPVPEKADAGFKEVLQDACQTTAADKVTKTASLGEIQNVGYHRIESSQQQILEGAASLLDGLERFVKEFGRPSKTLKDLEPALTDLKKQADMLAEVSRGEPCRDAQLSELVDRCRLRANVEYLKFMRGDYI